MVTKRRILKSIRNICISIVVLVIVAVGIGAGYTWYMGQNTTPITVQAEAVEVRTEIKHVQPAENAPVGASVQMISSPVAPGDNASISVRTTPYAECKILVMYDKTASKDSGLSPKIADDFGMVSWTWTVESSVPLGKWPVQTTCALGKKSGMVQADLVVAKP